MAGSQLEDAFGHHVWATQRLIDSCIALTDEQLATAVPGTYGSIIDTMRHLVGADSWYLFDITGDERFRIDEDSMGLGELRDAMAQDGPAWSTLLATDPDPATVVEVTIEEDAMKVSAPLGIRLAQALHHGTDHRSQICTALTALGAEPPLIDVWDFGESDGRVTETPLGP